MKNTHKMEYRKRFLILGFLLIVISTSAQKARIQEIESLFQASQNGQLNRDSIREIGDEIEIRSRELGYEWGMVQSQLLEGILTYKENKLDSSAKTFLHVINAGGRRGYPTYEEGRARNFMGLIFQRLNNFEKAHEQFVKSVQIFEALDNQLYKAMSLNNIGTNFGMLGEYPKALEVFLEIKEISESGSLSKADSQERLSKVLTNISIIYSLTGRNDLAKVIAKQSLQLNIALEDTSGISYSYINLGEISEDENELDSALFYYNLSLALGSSDPSHKFQQEVAARQKIASVYFKQGLVEKAANEIKKQIDFAGDEEKYSKEDSYIILAKYYQHAGQVQEALKYSRLAFKIGRKSGAKRTLRSATKKLSDLFYALNRYDSAYHYLNLHKAYNDSIFNESNERKFNNLRIELETAEQQREIENLKAKQEIESTKRKQRLYTTAFIITLLIATIIILIYRAKNAKKRQTIAKLNLQQELQQKETELQQQTLHMINLSNNMAEVEEKLKAVRKKENPSKQDVQKVLSNISIKKSMGEEWNKFESYFSNIHTAFGEELLAKHSNLSRQERRLIALIKMDLSNREIANLFNIEPRSVSMNKYRLKQKLGLTENDDLEDYINQIFGDRKN